MLENSRLRPKSPQPLRSGVSENRLVKLAITDLDYDYIAATNPSAALDIIERLERP